MNNQTNAVDLAQLLALHERATTGGLRIEELHSSLPDADQFVEPLRTVWRDLEDAVEHVPGRVIGGGIDRRTWTGSVAYRRTIWRTLALRAAVESGLTATQLERLVTLPADFPSVDTSRLEARFKEALAAMRMSNVE